VIQLIQKVIGEKKLAITFKFNRTKAIETILYLVSKVSQPDIYTICKLLYIVDKCSLEKYGRLVFGESYVAMKGGATPSKAYDLLKRIRREPTGDLKVQGYRIVALREADLNYLSKSDIECLDYVINKYGKITDWTHRKQESHDDAWQKAWDNRGIRGSNSIPIESIARTLNDSNDLIDYLMNSG
jgi:uncharacterized phage-associated protein